MSQRLTRFVDVNTVELFKNGKLHKVNVQRVPMLLKNQYFERTNQDIPKGKVRTLWFEGRKGYYWKGKIVKEIEPSSIHDMQTYSCRTQ